MVQRKSVLTPQCLDDLVLSEIDVGVNLEVCGITKEYLFMRGVKMIGKMSSAWIRSEHIKNISDVVIGLGLKGAVIEGEVFATLDCRDNPGEIDFMNVPLFCEHISFGSGNTNKIVNLNLTSKILWLDDYFKVRDSVINCTCLRYGNWVDFIRSDVSAPLVQTKNKGMNSILQEMYRDKGSVKNFKQTLNDRFKDIKDLRTITSEKNGFETMVLFRKPTIDTYLWWYPGLGDYNEIGCEDWMIGESEFTMEDDSVRGFVDEVSKISIPHRII